MDSTMRTEIETGEIENSLMETSVSATPRVALFSVFGDCRPGRAGRY